MLRGRAMSCPKKTDAQVGQLPTEIIFRKSGKENSAALVKGLVETDY
jgi:hypothetical protein